MVQKCRSCGCEDAIACPGFWVKEDLCSKCAQAIFVCRKCGHNLYVIPDIKELIKVHKMDCPSCGEDDDKLWILGGFGNYEADNKAGRIKPLEEEDDSENNG
jgi:hypothetical protein